MTRIVINKSIPQLWNDTDPIVPLDTPVIDTTSNTLKVGDGVTAWSSLPSIGGGGSGVSDGDKGDIVISGSGTTYTIDNDAVTYAKMQNVSTNNRLLGRITSGAGNAEELTGTQVTTLIDPFSSSLKGVVPASGGGTTNFIRADGSWAKPPGADYAYGILTADYTLTSTTSTQKAFNWSTNGALTLPTGKYIFRTYLYMGSMSGTSGNLGFDLKGAGTATINDIFFVPEGRDGGSLGAQAISSSGSDFTTDATSIAAPIVNAGTGTTFLAVIQGYFDITAAGTIIPSVALTTAAAAVVRAGSAFECIRVGDTGVTLQGSWS